MLSSHNPLNFMQYRHTASLMKDKLRPSAGRISAKPIISPAGKEHLPEIAALAQIIWRAHYPGIISAEQIDYMLAHMYNISLMEGELDNGIRYDRLLLQNELVGFASYGPAAPNELKL